MSEEMEAAAEREFGIYRAEIDRLRAALRHIRDSEHYAGGEAETLQRLQLLAGETLVERQSGTDTADLADGFGPAPELERQ